MASTMNGFSYAEALSGVEKKVERKVDKEKLIINTSSTTTTNTQATASPKVNNVKSSSTSSSQQHKSSSPPKPKTSEINIVNHHKGTKSRSSSSSSSSNHNNVTNTNGVSRSIDSSVHSVEDDEKNNDNDTTSEHSSESSEPKVVFVPAPPPLFNPWQKNTNAAQALSMKFKGANPSQQQQLLLQQQKQQPITNNQPNSNSLQNHNNINNNVNTDSSKILRNNKSNQIPSSAKPSSLDLPIKSPSSKEFQNNKFKGRRYSEKVSVDEGDWPTLDEAINTSLKSPTDSHVKVPALNATDSGYEDAHPSQTNQHQSKLNQTNWPSISSKTSRSTTQFRNNSCSSNNSNSNHTEEGGSEEDTNSGVCLDVENPEVSSKKSISTQKKSTSSSNGESSEVVSSGEENATMRKNKKSAKPKWVPLSLPETVSKPRSPRRDNRPYEKSFSKPRYADHSSSESYNNNNNNNNNHTARPISGGGGNSRPRGGGGRGRGGPRRPRYDHHSSNYYNNNNNNKEHEQNRGRGHRDYNRESDAQIYDNPSEFSTSPTYGMSEFIMPYVTPFLPWHATELGTYVYGGEEESLLIDIIRNQIEYYFSKENLEKDFYLRRKMNAEGYLPIRLISSFHRVQNLTGGDYGLVLHTIRSSKVLEMNSTHSYVRTRFNPLIWPIADLNPYVTQQQYQQYQPTNPTPVTVP